MEFYNLLGMVTGKYTWYTAPVNPDYQQGHFRAVHQISFQMQHATHLVNVKEILRNNFPGSDIRSDYNTKGDAIITILERRHN